MSHLPICKMGLNRKLEPKGTELSLEATPSKCVHDQDHDNRTDSARNSATTCGANLSSGLAGWHPCVGSMSATTS